MNISSSELLNVNAKLFCIISQRGRKINGMSEGMTCEFVCDCFIRSFAAIYYFYFWAYAKYALPKLL